jgi:hypothetical protein
MKTGRRFALNLLAPAPLAASILTLFFIAENPSWQSLAFVLYATPVAYVFALLPSLAHALWLQNRYRAGMVPRSARAVGYSSLTGTIAGLSIGLFFMLTSGGDAGGGLLMMIPLGTATGALNGMLQFLIREQAVSPV